MEYLILPKYPKPKIQHAMRASDEARKQGLHSGFETQGRRYQNYNTGVSMIPEKDLCLPIFLQEALHSAEILK